MSSLLILKRLEVENANAISGLTYGFPSITNFLGFTHALSRKLQKEFNITLGRCAIVSHNHTIHMHRPGNIGDKVFSLSRNPLTKEGNTPPFIEEGRMHMEVSIIVECNFDHSNFFLDDHPDENIRKFENYIFQQVLKMRLAGGMIKNIAQISFKSNFDINQLRVSLFKLLPGFVLVNRTDLLKEHYLKQKKENNNLELIDVWLDFFALKSRAKNEFKDNKNQKEKVIWEQLPKLENGWIIPIMLGYKAISPLYSNHEVLNVRDSTTPFRFVEAIYGIGEWIGLHKVNPERAEGILWDYKVEDDWYLCKNDYRPEVYEV